jgi:hypothetical protein
MNNKMTTNPRYVFEQTPDDIREEEKAMKEAKEKGDKMETSEKD